MTDWERARYENAKIACTALMSHYPFTLDDLDGELWHEVSEHYHVSTFGRVKSFCKGKVKILKLFVDTDGYLYATFSMHGKKIKRKIHRLVAQAFIPNPDGKPQINHIDGNKMNNHVSNLEWCTSTENNRHAVKIGLMKSGEEFPDAKLTNEQVAWCRRVYISGDKEFGTNALARKLGVSRSAMYLLLKGKTYRHIDGTTSVKHIEEAVSALDIKLDDETIKKLEAPYVPHIKTGAF